MPQKTVSPSNRYTLIASLGATHTVIVYIIHTSTHRGIASYILHDACMPAIPGAATLVILLCMLVT